PGLLGQEKVRLGSPLTCATNTAVQANRYIVGELDCTLSLYGHYDALLDTIRRITLSAPVVVGVSSVTMSPKTTGSPANDPVIVATVKIAISQFRLHAPPAVPANSPQGAH
ncbi:MAG: hypothetical protein ACYDGM_07900, partial [Vulcanimicrobiaceae bacterium]